MSMRVARRFDGIGLRFRTPQHELFVPVPLPPADQIPVYQELRPGVPMPGQPVPPPQPDAPVPPPPPQDQQPPQYPQHVYDVLPPAAQAIARDFDRRLRRLERYQRWSYRVQDALRVHAGLPEVPLSDSEGEEEGP